MANETCQSIYKGLAIGGVVGTVALMANKKTREKVITNIKDLSDYLKLIKNHREEIFDQVEKTTSKVSEILQETGGEIQKISDSCASLKQNSAKLVQTTQDVTDELKKLRPSN